MPQTVRRNVKDDRRSHFSWFRFRVLTVFICLPLLSLSTFFSTTGFPQQVQPAISAYVEEEIYNEGVCAEGDDIFYHITMTHYIIWKMPPYPFNDPGNPDGSWESIIWLAGDGPWLILALNQYEGRQQISYTLGCMTLTRLEQIRQEILNSHFRVFAYFRYPDGTRQGIFSTVPVEEPPEVLTKPEQVSYDKISTTPDPINIATGEMFVFATDFSMNGRGPALEFSRTYRSQTEFSGLLGYGWRSAYDVNLTENSDGTVIIFDKDGVGRYFTPNNDGTYTPSPGNHDALGKNLDGTFTATDKHGIVTRYNAEGRMTAVSDRNGNILTLIFDSPAGTYIEDAGGRRIALTLDLNGRIISAQDPAGRIARHAYDTDGNLIAITDPAGSTTHYLYDASHNITEMTNVNGHKTYFAYDNEDRAVMNRQDGDVNKVTLSFDSDTQTTVTDALGHATVYKFNDYGLATSVVDPHGHTTTTVWDENLNRISTTDARGSTTSFEYDTKGNLIKVIDAAGSQTFFSYTPEFNLLSSVTDALGQTTGYSYDAKGNLLIITDALGNTTQMNYDALGNLISTTDALNHAAAFEYDNYGQLVKTTNALAHVTALTYDAAGNNTSVTDPKGAVTQFTYDALNRLTQITFADGTSVSHAYDAFGNRLSMTDQKSQITINTYDAYERLIQTTDALGGVTAYAYDNLGNMISLTDSSGHTTNYFYDANGHLLRETTPLGHATGYSYDAVGNLVSKTDPNGNIIIYVYDALNRLTRVEYPDGTSVVYAYDGLGRPISMTDGQGTTHYSYDALGRLTGIRDPASNIIAYAYDAAGNRTTMTSQDGGTVAYTYDALNRLNTVTDAEGTTVYGYDTLSNITEIVYPSGASVHYSYDVMNRPVVVKNQAADDERSIIFTYEYDAAGMVIKISREDGTFTEYAYDALNRLVRESDHSYSYDAAGNRLELIKHKEEEGGKRIKETYSYDAGNRLLSLTREKEKDGLLIPAETLTYTYDANGNRMSKEEIKFDDDEQETEVTYYSYDYENRLTHLEYVGDSDEDDILNASFEYNGNGLRIKAVEGGEVTRYDYDGLNVLLEKDASGFTKKSYTRGLGFSGGSTALTTSGIGGLISMKRFEMDEDGLEEKTSYYHYDALGSVRGLSDEKGRLKGQYDYDVFGNELKHKGGVKKNAYRFSSKEFESHAGLYYFGARYYDPETGRWLTPDPLGFIDGPNVYAYVGNNPVNFMDPWGLRLAVATVSPGVGFGAAGHAFIISGNTAYSTAIFGEENRGINVDSEQQIINSYLRSGRSITFFELEENGNNQLENAFNNWVKSAEEGFYCVLGNNCADFVVRGLNEVGAVKGNLSLVGQFLPPGHGNTPISIEWSLLLEYSINQGKGMVKTFRSVEAAGKEKR